MGHENKIIKYLFTSLFHHKQIHECIKISKLLPFTFSTIKITSLLLQPSFTKQKYISHVDAPSCDDTCQLLSWYSWCKCSHRLATLNQRKLHEWKSLAVNLCSLLLFLSSRNHAYFCNANQNHSWCEMPFLNIKQSAPYLFVGTYSRGMRPCVIVQSPTLG